MTKLSDLSGQEMFALRQEIKQAQSGDMAPERKEELKYKFGSEIEEFEHFLERGAITDASVKQLYLDGKELLAALEETQQQVEERKIREIDLEEQYKTLYRMYTEMDKSCGETLDLLKETSCLLAEAQQTIARQREALKFYADKKTWNKPGVDQSGMALAALGEGAKES